MKNYNELCECHGTGAGTGEELILFNSWSVELFMGTIDTNVLRGDKAILCSAVKKILPWRKTNPNFP